MYKKGGFSHYLFETLRIWIHIKQSDPDPYQSEKQDTRSVWCGLDPQHCTKQAMVRTTRDWRLHSEKMFEIILNFKLKFIETSKHVPG
jgi:hypothetical protein